MKQILSISLLALALAPLAQADDAPASAFQLKRLDCYVQNIKTGAISDDFYAELTDHNPDQPQEKDQIWKRVEIPGFKGYYVDIWSYGPSVAGGGQEIDLRIKTKAQLGFYDNLAWVSGDNSVSVGVTLPGDHKESFELSCLPVNQ